MAQIRLYNEYGSAQYTANTPRSLRIVLNKAYAGNLEFEITQGIELSWVRQAIANWREETNQFEEIQ